jgi:AraC family transcriptional regulator
VESSDSLILTETVYTPGMRLPSHSHGSDHLAILLEGSYLERCGPRTYLCLPGDAVHYRTDIHHDNLFGAKFGRCLNLEFQPGEAPETCQSDANYVPAEVLTLLATNGSRAKRSLPRWMREARSRIDDFPAHSMSSLARELCIHPSHLAKSFRKAFGLSVGQYSMLARLKTAAKLLIETETPIAEVAFDSGFYDQSHFSNSFVRTTGFTPAALRHIAHN